MRDTRAHAERQTALPAVGLGTYKAHRGGPRHGDARRDRPGYRLLYSAFNYKYVPLPAPVTVGRAVPTARTGTGSPDTHEALAAARLTMVTP